MKTIIFRCDSSLQIGTGHLSRCRNLATELKKRGCNIFFICKNLSGNSNRNIANKFNLIEMKSLCVNKDKTTSNVFDKENKLSISKTYFHQEEDASEVLRLLRSRNIINIDWIILDHYSLDCIWEDNIRKGLR